MMTDLKHFLVGALGVAGLPLVAPAKAQQLAPVAVRMGAWPPIPDPLYYLDGQPLDSVGRLNPQAIARIDLLKGAAAEAYSPAARGRGVVFITSKRQQNRQATQALRRRVQQLQQYSANPNPVAYPQPPGVQYYLNGQPTSRAAVDTVGGRRVRSFRTLRGKQAAIYAHDPGATEVFLVETEPGSARSNWHERAIRSGATGRVLYYLDGRALSKAEFTQLDAATLDRAKILKGQEAARFACDSSVTGVVLLCTKRHRRTR